MDNLQRSRSETDILNSPEQLSYSRLGAEVDQEEHQKTKPQNHKILETPQKTDSKNTENNTQKQEENFTSSGPVIKINYSSTLTQPLEPASSSNHQQSKEKPFIHSMMNRSGLNKFKQNLKAIIEKRQEDELGSSQKSILTSQILNKVAVQYPCYSSQVHPQNHSSKQISQAQSLTVKPSRIQNKNVMIRPIDDSIEYQMDQDLELIQTSDHFTLPLLPEAKPQGPQSIKINQQMAILSSLTTQSKKYNHEKQAQPKNNNNKQMDQEVKKKKLNAEQNEIIQKIKSLQALVHQLKQKRDMASRQDQRQKIQLKNKLEGEIVEIKKRLQRLQNQQMNSNYHKNYSIPKYNINFLQQFLLDKVWQKYFLFQKLSPQQKSVVLSQIVTSLNIDIQLEIVKEKDEIVAICSYKKELAVIANSCQFYYGPYEVQNQKYSKQGFGLSFLPRNQVFIGNFHKNARQGKGLLITIEGEIYQGEFFSDLKHGNGKNLLKNGDVYQGTYEYNKFDGKGLYIWKNGDFYEGQFRSGNMEGRGRWWSRNGDQYEGEYKNGMKQGWGIYRYSSGKQFEGQFHCGKRIKEKKVSNFERRETSPRKKFLGSLSSTNTQLIFSMNYQGNSRLKQVRHSPEKFRINFK